MRVFVFFFRIRDREPFYSLQRLVIANQAATLAAARLVNSMMGCAEHRSGGVGKTGSSTQGRVRAEVLFRGCGMWVGDLAQRADMM